MTEGLVTTIIPVFNRPAQLREAVASVLAQDWRPIEVLVVDDGSIDDTLAVARELEQAHPGVVRVLTQANAGPGVARETGRRAARGEFIQYLDSDDVLLPGKFTAQVGALRVRPGRDVAYGMTRYRHADGHVEAAPWKGSGTQRDTMFPSFLNERWWDTPTPLYRAAICDKAGAWTDLRLEEDWEYDCRIASLGARLAWCPQFVCEVRDHDGGRLCRGEAIDARRLAHRARSHALVYGHARRAGIGTESAEMQRFARSLFLLARQCGAAGLVQESRELFALARDAAGARRSRAIDFRLYRAAASVVGWRAAGKASTWIDVLRGGHA
jgi:glycosyltransferase involved in cell wall biosynthesis